MNHEELAKMLDGSEYPLRLSEENQSLYKAHGLVVVYPHSDDIMMLGGALVDQFDCVDGGTAYVCRDGLVAGVDDYGNFVEPPTSVLDALVLAAQLKGSIKIKAIWGEDPC
jgi:hypothetical protein